MGRTRRGPRAPSARYLSWLIALLRLLGFKTTTISQAMASPYGRFACLTFDGLAPALTCAPALAKRQVSATVFVNTRGGPSLKHLPALAKAGWEIGSLGHELQDLTTCGYVEQRRLVSRSRSLIAARLGASPALFAYPFGAYDATTVSCVRNEGFQAAVTLRRGVNDQDLEAFHLKRVPLSGKSLLGDLATIVRTVIFARPTTTQAQPEAVQSGARTGAAL